MTEQQHTFQVIAPGKWLAMHTKYADNPDVIELLRSHDFYKKAFGQANWTLRNIVEGRELDHYRAEINRGERRTFNTRDWVDA